MLYTNSSDSNSAFTIMRGGDPCIGKLSRKYRLTTRCEHTWQRVFFDILINTNAIRAK